MAEVRVEITSSALAIAGDWADLVKRASANVFMDPTALNAVFDTAYAALHVLLAWDTGTTPRRLVGLWAFQEASITPFGPSYLLAPPHDYAFLSTPVVDPACMHEVMAAFLAAIAADHRRPKLVRVKYLDGPSETSAALLAALEKHGARRRVLSEKSRPFAWREDGVKTSGSTRKKMRQDWNRLSAAGAVDIANDPAAIEEAIEAFLAMEAAGWKGRQGTALVNRPADANFARRFLKNLAAERKASVALLRLDGRPIAAQVLLYAGDMAYTWKTAFDEAYAKYSPGALLVDKLTGQLFDAGMAAIESCSPEGGFMERVWQGRRQTIDLLADVGARSPVGYAVAALAENGRAEAKKVRNRLRAVAWLPKRKSAPAQARVSQL